MGYPVTSVANGRSSGGQFAPGNRFAACNPNSRRMHDLRQALLEAVSPDDRRYHRRLILNGFFAVFP